MTLQEAHEKLRNPSHPDWWPLLPTGPRAPAGGPVKTGCEHQYLSTWSAFISRRAKTSVWPKMRPLLDRKRQRSWPCLHS
jgi:hypothetical protein